MCVCVCPKRNHQPSLFCLPFFLQCVWINQHWLFPVVHDSICMCHCRWVLVQLHCSLLSGLAHYCSHCVVASEYPALIVAAFYWCNCTELLSASWGVGVVFLQYSSIVPTCTYITSLIQHSKNSILSVLTWTLLSRAASKPAWRYLQYVSLWEAWVAWGA